MGNPNEQIEQAKAYYDSVYGEQSRDYRTGGILGLVLLLGLIAAVVAFIVALSVTVF